MDLVWHSWCAQIYTRSTRRARTRAVASLHDARYLSRHLQRVVAMTTPSVGDLIRREITRDEHNDIRALWKAHSIAEDRRDIGGLIATLTPDCVYELPQTGHQWHGHDGAERFYRELLTAFPDIRFDLTNIVIGPQGVWEEASVRGTRRGAWLGQPPTGQSTEFTVLIFFPWDPARRKFRGERVYAFGDSVNDVLAAAAVHPNT